MRKSWSNNSRTRGGRARNCAFPHPGFRLGYTVRISYPLNKRPKLLHAWVFFYLMKKNFNMCYIYSMIINTNFFSSLILTEHTMIIFLVISNLIFIALNLHKRRTLEKVKEQARLAKTTCTAPYANSEAKCKAEHMNQIIKILE